jgi:hypothetical protein
MPTSAPRLGRTRLILAILHLSALGLLVVMAQPAQEDIRARRTYRQSECTILSGRVVQLERTQLPAPFRWGASGWRPQISFQLVTNDEIRHVTGYSSWPSVQRNQKAATAVLAKYPVGSKHACWYDPDDPFKAVLTFGSPWNYAILVIPVLFAGITFAALIAAFRAKEAGSKGPQRRARR